MSSLKAFQVLVNLRVPVRTCAHSLRPLKHTHHSSKALLLCPKGQTVARPSLCFQKGANVPFGLRSCDFRTGLPQGRTLSLPLFQEGSLHPRAMEWGPLGRLWGKRSWGGGGWGGDGRALRDKQMDEKATSKRRHVKPDPQGSQLSQHIVLDAPAGHICVRAVDRKFKPQHSRGPRLQ